MAEQEWSTIPASQTLPEITGQNKSDLSGPDGAISEPGEGTSEPPVQPAPPKRGKRKPTSASAASRPRQAKQQHAGTESDGPAASSSAKQKQSTRAKSRQDAGDTRATPSRKKKARAADPLEPVFEFEPDLEATPVKPRERSRAEHRAALFSDDGPQALPEETGMDATPFQAEETLKRPIVFLQAPPDELPSSASVNGHRVELPLSEPDSSPIEPEPDAAQHQKSDEPPPENEVAAA